MIRSWQNWNHAGVAEKWDDRWTRREGRWRDILGRDLLEALGTDRRIIEIGCGSGLVYGVMLDRGITDAERYTGGDVTPAMLDISRRKWPGVAFRELDILDIALPDRSQPTVISINVLQHLPDFLAGLSELLRITSDTLYIVTWFNNQAAKEQIKRQSSFGHEYYENIYHLQRFLDFIEDHEDRPHEVRVRHLSKQNYSVMVTFQ